MAIGPRMPRKSLVNPRFRRVVRRVAVDPPEPPDPDEVFFITSEGQPFLTADGDPLKPEAA